MDTPLLEELTEKEGLESEWVLVSCPEENKPVISSPPYDNDASITVCNASVDHSTEVECITGNSSSSHIDDQQVGEEQVKESGMFVNIIT